MSRRCWSCWDSLCPATFKDGVEWRCSRATRTLADNDVFVQWNGVGDRDLGNEAINRMAAMPRRSVVTGDRWKLNLCATDQCELFDLGSDPHEMSNLFDLPEHRDRVRDMAARIRLWQHRTGDDAPLPSV